MSLNWKIEDKATYEAVTTDEEWGKTQALIFFTMTAGLPSTVTAESAADWFARVSLYEALNGALVYGFDENDERVDVFFTPEDIVKRIGLWTNGHFGRKETFAAFVKRVTQYKEAEAKRRFAEATAELAA